MPATLYRRARLATLADAASGLGSATLADPAGGLGLVEGGAVLVEGGRIAYAGPEDALPEAARGAEPVDCAGRLLTPGLVDCHTHLVHGGERSNEWEMRLAGSSYEEIARAGGGIASTVRATRAASDEALLASGLGRLDALLAEGVTTVEIKSGYGLDAATEARMLRAARGLGAARPVTVRTSFLGAHALPPEWRHDREGYLGLVAEMLPALRAEGLVDAVDAFCEGIAFSPAEVDRLFDAAHRLGLPVKLHADQLSDLGGAALAARCGALSADHLEWCSEAGAAALAAAGTVAVLLPGACYFLREERRPPVAAFRRHGTRMAVATDCNPGTSPLTSLLMAANMAATLFGLTVEECIAGVTREAARALGLLGESGTLEAGKWADLAVWDVERPAELVCRMGAAPLWRRVHRGVAS